MRESTQSLLFGSEVEKPVVFKLVKRRDKPALKGRHYPSIKRLPGEETVYDPITKRNRVIRYAPGEQSIYKDEQPEKVVLGDIVFQNGSLIVDHRNPLLLEYLQASNYNKDNKDRMRGSKAVFAVLDQEANAKTQLDTEVEEIKAANAVLQMPFGELKAYARVLGVNINNGADMIRHDMLVLAKKAPASFMSGIDDPIVKRQQVLLDAVSFGVIEIGRRSMNWVMGEKRSLIIPIPLGENPARWVAEWTMNDKDGEDVYKEIEKKLKALTPTEG